MKWYTKFNRFGYINPYNETANREYLFFTKPDLNIFSDDKDNDNYNDRVIELMKASNYLLECILKV